MPGVGGAGFGKPGGVLGRCGGTSIGVDGTGGAGSAGSGGSSIGRGGSGSTVGTTG
jgi:hypothetical protein